MPDTLLFSDHDLRQTLENVMSSIRGTVLKVPEKRFDSETDEQIAGVIASDLVIDNLEIDPANTSVASRDARVDISDDPFARVFDRSQPFYVEGIEVKYHVPFRGDKNLLRMRGSSFTLNPPRASVEGQELVFRYITRNQDIAGTKASFEQDLQNLQQHVPWVTGPVDEFNGKLEASVRQEVARRRGELSKTASDLQSLGFKVRSEVPSTPKPSASTARRVEKRARAAKQYDVALSFAGENRSYVSAVADRLRDLGLEVFYDDFEQAELWGKELTAHLADVYANRSRYVVIFASHYYASKAWPNHERANALSKQFSGQRDRVLPVRFDATAIPGLPTTVGYLDARVLTPDKIAELVRQKVDAEGAE